MTHVDMTNKIGANISQLRTIRRLTQDNMAYELGISQSAYSKYESGETKITEKLLDQIAKILEVDKEIIEQFDDNAVFSNNTNNAKDQAKSNLLIGNNSVTVNHYGNEEKDGLYEKMISLLEEKVNRLEKELGKKE